MRIGFEAKKAISNFTGIGNYSRGVINALSSFFPDNQYYLFSPTGGCPDALSRLRTSGNIEFRYPSSCVASFLKEWWRCRGVVKDLIRNRIDIYHGLSNELPWGIRCSGVKTVVTVHDLIFLRYPDTYGFISYWLLKFKVLHACRCADRIIAISQRTRQDIMDFYHIPENKIDVVYQGCDQIFYEQVPMERMCIVKSKYRLPAEYILCVGTIEHRKNQLSIIKALPLLEKKTPLVIVGKQTAYQQVLEREIKKFGFEDRVFILNHVPNSDLPAIYQGASLFVYPSYYEGFGIPVLEALVSGIPVIAGKGSCLEEAGGPDSRYCNPFDKKDIAFHINSVLSHPDEMVTMIEKGREYAGNFVAEKIAKEVITTYGKVINFD